MTWDLFLGPLIVWTWKLVSWGYWAAPECHSYPLARGKVQGGGVDVLKGCDQAMTAHRDIGHGWSGCSATGSIQS
jgi:hypothetical protein